MIQVNTSPITLETEHDIAEWRKVVQSETPAVECANVDIHACHADGTNEETILGAMITMRPGSIEKLAKRLQAVLAEFDVEHGVDQATADEAYRTIRNIDRAAAGFPPLPIGGAS